ncbi:transposase-like protein [Bradyrhizobium sp. USDA 3256]
MLIPHSGRTYGPDTPCSATTTHAIRAAIQRSKASLKELAAQHGLNQKTVAKWRKRAFVHDAPMSPKTVRSTVLSTAEEAMIVAFRKHTLLPLDDCLYALQATIPHLTRSSLHRCLQRHGISRLPETPATSPPSSPSSAIPLATSTSTSPRSHRGRQTLSLRGPGPDQLVRLCVRKATGAAARAFLDELVAAVPYQIHTGQRHPIRRPAQEP